MAGLERIHRSFLLKETITGMIINAILNGIITFFMFRSQEAITLWGKNGLFFDLIPTIFFMTFCMSLGMTPATRARILKGKAPAAPWHRSDHAVFRFFPGAILLRAFVFGGGALLVLLPTSTGLLMLLTEFPISFTEMMVLKISFGALIGLLLTPGIIMVAMAD
jgi:hypothetical protein